MNEKEKTIEDIFEMKKHINHAFDIAYRTGESDIPKAIAEELIQYYRPKIPEGSVVLDRQEHQKYCAYKIIEPQIKGCLDRERELEKQVKELEEQRDRQAYIAEDLIQEKHRWTEQARKETAEKILKDIMFCIDINDCNKNEMLIFNLCKMLAKQFGVEVEE